MSKCLPCGIERLDFDLDVVVAVDNFSLSCNAWIDSGQDNALQPFQGLVSVLRRHWPAVIALLLVCVSAVAGRDRDCTWIAYSTISSKETIRPTWATERKLLRQVKPLPCILMVLIMDEVSLDCNTWNNSVIATSAF